MTNEILNMMGKRLSYDILKHLYEGRLRFSELYLLLGYPNKSMISNRLKWLAKSKFIIKYIDNRVIYYEIRETGRLYYEFHQLF